jgi:hypothetical protein
MQATVTLGTQTFQISSLSARASRDWRSRVQKELMGMLDSVQNLSSLQLDNLTFDSVGDLLGVARTLLAAVSGMPDLIVDLVFQYSPELQAQRDVIEGTATDEQFVTAFVEVLKLAFPFSAILSSIALVPSGPSKATSQSSPSPSGETGTKSS